MSKVIRMSDRVGVRKVGAVAPPPPALPPAKKKTFVCQACGERALKWAGKCAECGVWNTIVEEDLRVSDDDDDEDEDLAAVPNASRITKVGDDLVDRISTGISELDRVLGGGLVPGGIILLSGKPGAGKSTLLLQAMASLAKKDERTLYVSGEERIEQTGARARRIGIKEEELFLISTGNLEKIFAEIERIEPTVVVFDSIQTIRTSGLDTSAGSVSQLKECTAQIISFCKEREIAAFIIGHINKEGNVAGPKLIEHLVDTVLAFEGDKHHSLRVLRVDKNREGGENEIGVFEMTATGMMEVPSPSAWLLAERSKNAAGSVICCSCEGTRSMLVEIQAKVSLKGGSGKRIVMGTDATRLGIILAILDCIPNNANVFLNLAGGVKIVEPGIDLGIAIAIISSAVDTVVPEDIAVFGEIGLAGEIRGVGRLEARVNEAIAMGFKRIIVPKSVSMKVPRTVTLKKVETVEDALVFALGYRDMREINLMILELRKKTMEWGEKPVRPKKTKPIAKKTKPIAKKKKRAKSC